jgi:hypothetical protein
MTADLDARHAAAAERACNLDRRFAELHPDVPARVRASIPHELCVPGYRCRSVAEVHVVFFAPGVRARLPL